MAFFGPWDRWQISGVQSLPRDASVFVELDFGHGEGEREGKGQGWSVYVGGVGLAF